MNYSRCKPSDSRPTEINFVIPRAATMQRTHHLARAVVITMLGHTVSLYRLQSEGASSGRANRIVVAEEHLDCYLHGCPCGYQGDTRCACSCAPGATGRYQQRQSTGHRSPFAIHLESLRPTTQASEQGVCLFPARWLVSSGHRPVDVVAGRSSREAAPRLVTSAAVPAGAARRSRGPLLFKPYRPPDRRRECDLKSRRAPGDQSRSP
jgi:hypothetical protein